MLIGLIHKGSGIGDQLFTYITTRTVALDKGYDFGFVGKEFFKGKDFIDLEWGKESNAQYTIEQNTGKLLINDQPRKFWEPKTPYYDPEVNFIEDGTVIDAYGTQDERYWGHSLNQIKKWLKVEPLEMPDDLCVINFRGGEYVTVPDLFLSQEYWLEAIKLMSRGYPSIRYEVHTDDIETAKKFFPFTPIRDISYNWRSVRYAKHLVLSNSAFGILPALLNENVKEVIAPLGWNARNANSTKWLGRPMNYYKKFTYI